MLGNAARQISAAARRRAVSNYNPITMQLLLNRTPFHPSLPIQLSPWYRHLWHPRSPSRCITTKREETYDDAIKLLNTLQTPHHILEARRKLGIRIDKNANLKLIRCLSLLGHKLSDLDELSIVHVAGTKGKGATCAFVDSILSQWRHKTRNARKIGLFTSPHLVAVRERIRINSVPITARMFAYYFFEVWDTLHRAEVEKPIYFRFLTLMSYHVFLSEHVDIAIYETGVGGEYDSTNIVEHPAVTGITSLGIDHTSTLGNTIEEIAWNKAGIQKLGTPSFTVHQPQEAMEVLMSRAQEKKTHLMEVPMRDPRLPNNLHLTRGAEVQKTNANLAVALAETVLQRFGVRPTPADQKLPEMFIDGLKKMVWPGRFQLIKDHHISWYLDGAHTEDSLALAVRWYTVALKVKTAGKIRLSGGVPDDYILDGGTLIFNQQGERDAMQLLEFLYQRTKHTRMRFSKIIFCTNTIASQTQKSDSTNHTYGPNPDLSLQNAFAARWKELEGPDHPPPVLSEVHTGKSIKDASEPEGSAASSPDTPNASFSGAEIHVVSSLDKAILNVKKSRSASSEMQNVFITGSLHLVGGVLEILGVTADFPLHQQLSNQTISRLQKMKNTEA